MANFWTIPSDKTIATIEERVTVRLSLPVNGRYLPLATSGMTVTVISGNIPKGMRLSGYEIIGTPFEVVRDTKYEFCVRASLNGVINDRTFNVIVTGADDPVWTTPEGSLPVGSNKALFIIDSAPLDYQLIAVDPDITAGDHLEYTKIAGEIPPGITLTNDGRLVGVVEPILALEKPAGSGFYDENNYGSFPFDFGERSSNGFDSFFYDLGIYDLSTPTQSPKKLNRYYEFTVRVSDGDSIADRTFKIYVVGDDFLRADNSIMQVANGIFTADVSNVRVPIWLTPSNFGFRRANNYVTLYLDVIDPNPDTGIITYSLLATNDDASASVLPPGLVLDLQTGELGGKVPYQPAITIEYKFTVRATRSEANTTDQPFKDKTFTINLLGEIDSVITWNTASALGSISSNYISTLSITATTTVPNANLLYILESGSLPPGLRLGPGGDIIGKINSFGSVSNPGLTVFDNQSLILDGNTSSIDREFSFTVSVRDHFGYSKITRTFTLSVTDPDDKLYSNINVRPLLPQSQRSSLTEIITDSRIFDNDKIYRPNDPNFGLQKNLQMLIYAGIETKLINQYVAAMAKNHKRKKFKLGDVKTAIAKNPGSSKIVYEVVYIEVIDPAESTTGVKTRDNFTITTQNKNSVDSEKYTSAGYTIEGEAIDLTTPDSLTLGTRRFSNIEVDLTPSITVTLRDSSVVRITSGDGFLVGVRSGLDITSPITQGQFDPYRFRPNPENTVKVDSDALSIDGANDTKRFISSIDNMRARIQTVGETEINFLPLWMRTSQPGAVATLGFVNAIPLAYCKPGQSTSVKNAINNANIKFNQFNYDIDRYVIDSTTGVSEEKYIMFANYKYNL